MTKRIVAIEVERKHLPERAEDSSGITDIWDLINVVAFGLMILVTSAGITTCLVGNLFTGIVVVCMGFMLFAIWVLTLKPDRPDSMAWWQFVVFLIGIAVSVCMFTVLFYQIATLEPKRQRYELRPVPMRVPMEWPDMVRSVRLEKGGAK